MAKKNTLCKSIYTENEAQRENEFKPKEGGSQ